MKRLTDKDKLVLSSWLSQVGGIRLDKILCQAQLNFINDPNDWVAALCERQSGKTYALAAYMLHILLTSRKNIMYCALTRASAKRILWQKLQDICNDFNLKCNFKQQDLEIVGPYGNKIYLCGLDNAPQEQAKIRGQTYKLFIIDEAGHYTQNLEDIINDVVLATIKQEQGKLFLIGTPGNILNIKNQDHQYHGDKVRKNDLFFRITREKEHGEREAGWSVHKWSALDNEYTAESERKYREKLLSANPLIQETPMWKREVLGQWYIDTGLLVFKFDRSRNIIYTQPYAGGMKGGFFNNGLPAGQEYTYSMGIDLGWKDPTALVVCAYGRSDQKFYVVDYYKAQEMTLEAVEKKIDFFRAKYPISGYYADTGGAGSKQLFEELSMRMGIKFTQADKHAKYDFIELLNHDFLMGNIKIIRSSGVGKDDHTESNELIAELETCIWDENNPTEIYSGCEDHLIDALRYCWRHAYYYVYRKPAVSVVNNIEQEMDAYWKKRMQKSSNIIDNYVQLGGKNYL